MREVMADEGTEIFLEGDEPKKVCKLGQGSECCAFLVAGEGEFRCWKLNYPSNTIIWDRVEKGTMNAKGKGGWVGCYWGEKE